MIYLTLIALFVFDDKQRLDVSRYQVEPQLPPLQLAQLEQSPFSVYRHQPSVKPDCAVNEEGKGRRVIDCTAPDQQGYYRLFVYPDYHQAVPVGETRSRLPRTPDAREIRSVGPKFLQEPEDELDLRFPGR